MTGHTIRNRLLTCGDVDLMLTCGCLDFAAVTDVLTEPVHTVWRAFFRMQRELDRVIEAQLAEHRLSHADYTVLSVLAEDDSALRAGAVGDRIGWESSRLAHHLRRMEQRGLVIRTICPSDRRGTMVAITPSGRSAVEAARPGHLEVLRRHLIDQMSPSEVSCFTELGQRVASSVELAMTPANG